MAANITGRDGRQSVIDVSAFTTVRRYVRWAFIDVDPDRKGGVRG